MNYGILITNRMTGKKHLYPTTYDTLTDVIKALDSLPYSPIFSKFTIVACSGPLENLVPHEATKNDKK